MNPDLLYIFSSQGYMIYIEFGIWVGNKKTKINIESQSNKAITNRPPQQHQMVTSPLNNCLSFNNLINFNFSVSSCTHIIKAYFSTPFPTDKAMKCIKLKLVVIWNSICIAASMRKVKLQVLQFNWLWRHLKTLYF